MNIIYHLYVESKKAKLAETERKVVDTRGWGGDAIGVMVNIDNTIVL